MLVCHGWIDGDGETNPEEIVMALKAILGEMTRDEIGELAGSATAILPTAAIEQHGPHLAIETDRCIGEAVCRLAAERAAARIPVTVAPTLVYGISEQHLPYPGVLTLSSGTFLLVLREVCESLVRSGFTRIAIVNGHGGNEEAVRLVARDLVNVHRISVAATSYWSVAQRALADLIPPRWVPGHAGLFESSLMLALRPDLVRERPGGDGRPPVPGSPAPQPRHLTLGDTTITPAVIVRAGRRIGDGPGYTDDPSAASTELGRRLLDVIADELASFIVEFHES